MRIREIDESFDSTPYLTLDGYPGDKYSMGFYNTNFEVAGQRYLVDIAQNSEPDTFRPEVWIVEFRQASSPGYTPTGNVGKDVNLVLGGVVHAVRTFVSEHAPDAIGFTGKHKDRLGRLYLHMSKRLGDEIADMGYRVQSFTARDAEAILLYREGEAEDYLS